MTFSTTEIQDTLNRTVIFRSADERDAEALIKYMKETATETSYLIREPDEVKITKEQEIEFINACSISSNSLMLIAELEGQLVGCCSINPVSNFRRYAHRCEIAIALYQKYCGYGIGRKLIETALKAAKDAGYEQSELEVVSENKKAIALYEKIGFKKYGTFPDNMKYTNGTYNSVEWMMKKL